MKNHARPRNSVYSSTASSSMLRLDQTSDSVLAQRSHELFLANAEITQLQYQQAQLKAELSESHQQRDALAAQLLALQEQTGHYTSAELLSVLRTTVKKRDEEIERLKAVEETDRLVLIDAVRKVLRRAKASAKSLLQRFVPPQFEEQLSTGSPVKAAVTMLRFAEALLTDLLPNSDQLTRVSQLEQEIQATLQRSNQLLQTPKRELGPRPNSQLERPLARSKTRVSICKPKTELADYGKFDETASFVHV